uniref:Uncharacterized protein n=1 Tax=Rhizophora mucronata TaxID=61149 RepID=A0A2P2IPH2_RHIMU
MKKIIWQNNLSVRREKKNSNGRRIGLQDQA